MCNKSLLLTNRLFFFRIVICSDAPTRMLTWLILRSYRMTASLVRLLVRDEFWVVYIAGRIVVIVMTCIVIIEVILSLILKRDSHVQWQRAHGHQSWMSISVCWEARWTITLTTVMRSWESIHIAIVSGTLLVIKAVSLVRVDLMILWLNYGLCTGSPSILRALHAQIDFLA